MSIAAASFVPTQQLTPLFTSSPAGLNNATFPPPSATLAGATQPPFARFGAGFLNAILPTQQVSQVQSPFATATVSNPGIPTAPGTNAFSASYAPEIYAVYVNGLIAGRTVASAQLATNTYNVDIARPPISGDPAAPIPGAPPSQPIPVPEGVSAVIAAIAPLAGSGQIFSSAPAQTATANTGAAQSSASHSTSHVATR